MKRSDWITVAAVLSGIGLILLGAFSGQAQTVMKSAIRICLECIGIG